MSFLKRLWEGWKKVARKIGNFQARLLLGIFYFVILGPVCLIMNIRGDALHLKPGSTHGWKARQDDGQRWNEKAAKQF